jgi:hypothetical protein
MFERNFMSGVYYKICQFILFLMAASASFNGFYTQCHFHETGITGGWAPISFQNMVDGTAWRPYVYRQMLPSLANWMDQDASQAYKDRWFNLEGKDPHAYISAIAASPAVQNKAYFFRYLVIYGMTFLFALLAVYAMYLVCRALEFSEPVAVLAAVVIILMLPYFMMSSQNSGYFYDYPELAFLALAVWITLKFDWWWAIPIAALGTWNKESFLFAIPSLYPLIRRRTSRFGALLGVAVLCAACIAVYYPERLHFAHNLGGTVEFQWRAQLESFLHPANMLFSTQQTYGVRVIRAFSVLPLSLLIWTVWRAWKGLPLALRRHGQIAAVINFPLYLVFCTPGELRDLSLLYMVLLAVVAANLNSWLDSLRVPDATANAGLRV